MTVNRLEFIIEQLICQVEEVWRGPSGIRTRGIMIDNHIPY